MSTKAVAHTQDMGVDKPDDTNIELSDLPRTLDFLAQFLRAQKMPTAAAVVDRARARISKLEADAARGREAGAVRHSAPHTAPGAWTYDGHGLIWAPSLKGGETRVLDVRGWGYLTGSGHGALGLPGDEAKAAQDAWGQLVVDSVNARLGEA